jgi:Winged helix-turn-helix DNA-binding
VNWLLGSEEKGRRVIDRDGNHWTFLSSHTQVLLYLSRDPNAPLDELAKKVGIDQLAARHVLGDLIEAGYVEVNRVDGHDGYAVNHATRMRHDFQSDRDVGELLTLFKLEPMAEA